MPESTEPDTGHGSKPSSNFESYGDRFRFNVELRPGDTTIVSWKKLLREANITNDNSNGGPSGLEAQNQHQPPVPLQLPISKTDGEAQDVAATNGPCSVIERIERIYAGNGSSDQDVVLDDVPDDDEYNTEDSFIDDTELLAALWPSDLMENYGIKHAIYRAKKRKKLQPNRHKNPENIKKKKKLITPKTQDTSRGEVANTAQTSHAHDKVTSDSHNQFSNQGAKQVPSATIYPPAINAPLSLQSLPNIDEKKQEKIKGSSRESAVNAWSSVKLLQRKKVKKKPSAELGDRSQFLLENTSEERLSVHHKDLNAKPNAQPSLTENTTSTAISSINRCPCPDHISSENADAEEPAEVPIFNKGCEFVRLSIPRDITEASKIRDNKCYLDIHMDRSTSKSDQEVHQKLDIGVISDVGSQNLNTKGFDSAQVSRPMVGVNTQKSGSFTAIMDSSNITFCATSSNVLPDDHKGIPDTFLEARSHTVPPLTFQCSAGRKRKAEDTQIYGPDIDAVTDMIGTVNGAVITDLAKDLSSALEVVFPVENGSSKESSTVNEGSLGVKDSDIDFDVDYPSSEHKKRKVLISESIPSLPLEDDLVAESNCSKFDNMSECDTIESESTSECDTTYVKEKVSEENVARVDKTADGSKHHERDDWDFIANTLSLSGDANDVSTSNSVDELDEDYCPSSPEDLLSHTDFSFSPNRSTLAFQPKGQITRRRDAVLQGNTCIAHVKKAPSLYQQNITRISILEGKTKLPPKLKSAGGTFSLKKNQLTSSVPNVFPSRHPPYHSSRKFQPSHVTKSRTWHRSDNSSAAVTGVKQQPSIIPQSQTTKVVGAVGTSYIRKGNSLVRNPSQSVLPPAKLYSLGPSINRSSPPTGNVRKNQASDSKISKYGAHPQLGIERRISSDSTKETLQRGCGQPSNRRAYNLGESVQGSIIHSNGPALASSKETAKAPIIAECRTSSLNKVMYVRKRSNQLIAASDTEDSSVQQVTNTQDGYYKKRKNQLVRASVQNLSKKENGGLNVNSARHGPPAISVRSSVKRRSYFKTNRLSKFSLVWKLHETKSSEKPNNLVGPKMVLPHLIPWKRATYRKSFMDALISKPNNPSSVFSHKILLSRKRGAIYTRSTHGYSLRMSKVLSIGGSSLKWSKSLEKNSKKVKEDAARSVAAASRTRKEEKIAPPDFLKSRNISRKLFPSGKPRPGEGAFRVCSERYKMDSSGRTLLRITGEESSSLLPKIATDVKKSYIPRKLLIGSEEYVRIGNGNQLVRDPKRRTRLLASERVRWSLRTARLRLARKKTYCQFFTRFGKCNKEDGKCPYIHDLSKIAVCTKFLTGTCSNADCKLTHKVIPERMQDCSYFLKGSCSNENCPYRHVILDPDSAVCESFLRGYCADGNECRKKHTYVCPTFEETGTCPQSSTCKLHHPKKKTEKKPLSEQKKIVRGRYFDGGLTQFRDFSMMETAENLSFEGKSDLISDNGKYPDYISLDMSDEELEHTSAPEEDDDNMRDEDNRIGSPLAFDGLF